MGWTGRKTCEGTFIAEECYRYREEEAAKNPQDREREITDWNVKRES